MISRLVVIVSLVGVLAACDNTQDPPAPAPATPPPAANTSAPPPPPDLTPIPAPPDVAAPPKDATRTASGLAFKVLQPGSGTERPTTDSMVLVHYTGWTTDGQMFDSSVARGKPAALPLYQMIPGWIEGVPLMARGEKRRFWIPSALAYGGRPGRPQGLLVFDVELLDFR
jgi:peptidylprolyl isomerase